MLEGITVLNQYAAIDFNAKLFFTLLLIFGIISMFACVAAGEDWLFYPIFFGAVVLFAVPAAYSKSEDRLRYECTIDESVSMTEVYERYEIVEQRGDIWVLEDKE